jgi:hypothetical protein
MASLDQEIFERLTAHGFPLEDYVKIKQLVSWSFPQARFRFYREFRGRTINQVLRQIDKDRKFLAKDFILPAEEKLRFEKSFSIAEMLAWQAILEINCYQVGHWRIETVQLPTAWDEDGQPQYRNPNLKIIAVHIESEEERQAIIPGQELADFGKRAQAWKHAYQQLGIWDLVYLDSVNKGVLSARRPHAWAVFTKYIIPRLYEYLLPYYEKPGHYSRNRDTFKAGKAQYPNELFEDMLLILHLELPEFFSDASACQIKAAIQKYLEKRKSTISSKKPEIPARVLSLPSTESGAL